MSGIKELPMLIYTIDQIIEIEKAVNHHKKGGRSIDK